MSRATWLTILAALLVLPCGTLAGQERAVWPEVGTRGEALASRFAARSLPVGTLQAAEETRGHARIGAVIGLGVGLVATYLVLHGGGSTALCDRSRNQDAMSSGECLALTVGGGLVGAGLGALVGSRIRSAR